VDGDLLICCDICKVVQHRGCVSIEHEHQRYFCEMCHPDLHKLMTGPKGQNRFIYIPAKILGRNRNVNPSGPFLHMSISSDAYSDIYHCTYHGCSQLFETTQMLHEHERVYHREADAKPGPDSFWRVSELKDLETNIANFGTEWLAIATNMGTKTQTMVKDQYLRLVEQVRTDLKEIAESLSALKILQSLRQINEEKESRLRQLEQAVEALLTDHKKPRTLDLEAAAESSMPTMESDWQRRRAACIVKAQE
jgi:hypothetical protein